MYGDGAEHRYKECDETAHGRYEPPARTEAYGGVANGEIYMWGGWYKEKSLDDTTRKITQLQDYVERFNIFSEEWHKIKQRERSYQPPRGLYGGGTAIKDHYIYLYGGFDNHAQHHGGLYRYDIRSNIWLELWKPYIHHRQRDGPRRKAGTALLIYENKLILFGGSSDWRFGTTQVGSDYLKELTNEQHEFHIKESKLSMRVS